MDINADTIIGDVVKMNYKTAQVFEDSSIDFCCGGGISLKQACEKGSVNMNELIVKLEDLFSFPMLIQNI